MTTQKKVEEKNSQELSISLTFKNKQNLYFSIDSLCNLAKSSLILSVEHKELSEHTTWDIYNTIEIIRSLTEKK